LQHVCFFLRFGDADAEEADKKKAPSEAAGPLVSDALRD
jgi:hypothetical protein